MPEPWTNRNIAEPLNAILVRTRGNWDEIKGELEDSQGHPGGRH